MVSMWRGSRRGENKGITVLQDDTAANGTAETLKLELPASMDLVTWAKARSIAEDALRPFPSLPDMTSKELRC